MSVLPKYIFIVPYRDRDAHRIFFLNYMNYILEDFDKESYEIIFSHQNDKRPFNRGAMKNIGFDYIRNKYPDHYRQMVFVFQDVDTMPHKKNLLDYDVSPGEIKHFYGYTFALGGIFSITGADFEFINGFPNYWKWGFEDNVIYNRAVSKKLTINRNTFFSIHDMEILHFFDHLKKEIDTRVLKKQIDKTVERDGLNSLNNISYAYNNQTNMVDVSNFQCSYSHNNIRTQTHNMLSGTKVQYWKRRPTMAMKLM